MARKNSEQIKVEYNQAVKEINKAIRKLSKHDPDSVTLDRYRGYFKPVTSKRPDYEEVRKMYKQAKELLESGSLSIEGHERSIANAIETLHRDGYEFINRRNFNSFMRFLDDARARGLGSLYSSEQILEAVHRAKQKGLTESEIRKNIDRWSDQISMDNEGRVIEVKKPKQLRVLKYDQGSK